MSDFESTWMREYATRQQGRPRPPTPEEIAEHGATADHHMDGWLPEDRSTPILEVGCGSGWFLSALAARGFANISGLDLSPSQVALARELGHEVHEAGALEFLAGRDSEFGLIVVMDVLEHLTRQQAWELLEYALKALRPGGRIIFQTPNGDSPWVGNVFYGDPTHITCYAPLLLEKIMLAAGFEQVEMRPSGPVPSGILKRIRYWAWRLVHGALALINRLEGAVWSGIQTRNFLCAGIRPDSPGRDTAE